MAIPSDTPAAEATRSGIRWEEPPIKSSRGSRLPWDVWARALKRSPGRWARLQDFGSKSGAYSARNSKFRLEHMPPDCYELRAVANDDDSGSVLYARYVELDDD